MAQDASPHAIDIPRWFTDSFLDFREERPRRRPRRTPAHDLLRPGRLSVLHGAHGDELLAAQHRRQDDAAFRRDRAQHLGRPRDDVDRRTHDERKGARAEPRRAVHADAPLLRRAGRGRRAAQRLLSAAPVRGRARLRAREAREREASLGAWLARARARSGERPARRRAVLPAAALRSSSSHRAASRSQCCSRPRIAVHATSCIAKGSSAQEVRALLRRVRRRALRARARRRD